MKSAKNVSVNMKPKSNNKTGKPASKKGSILTFSLNQNTDMSNFKLCDRAGYDGVIGTFKLG